MKRRAWIVVAVAGLGLLLGALGLLLSIGETPPPPVGARGGAPQVVYEVAQIAPPSAAPSLSGPTGWRQDAPRTVVGTVTDDEGQPVPGAAVVLVGDQGRRSARTNAQGRYRLTRAATAVDSLTVTATGFEVYESGAQALPREARTTLDVVLTPKPGLRGQVRVADGAPAAQARLVLRRPGQRRWLGTTLTDGVGRFYLEWPGDEALHLSAYHAQHGQARIDVAQASEVSIELPGGAWIEGRVVDGDGDPVPGFSVTASPLTRMSGGPPAQSFDNADGRFVLGPLAAGRMRVWAAAEGYQPGEATGLRLEPGERHTGLVLTLKQSSVLTGRVTDARTGQPVVGANVIPAEWRARALAEMVGGYTDDDGRYTLRALPGVRTSVRVTAEGYRSLLLGGVEGGPGERIVRDFELTPTDGDRPQGELTGIGAVLRPHLYGVRLSQLVEGGPAAEVLGDGDVVTAVDGRSAKGLGMKKVAQAIRGEEGSEVVLTVRRKNGSGPPEEVVLVRGRVAFPQRRHHN